MLQLDWSGFSRGARRSLLTARRLIDMLQALYNRSQTKNCKTRKGEIFFVAVDPAHVRNSSKFQPYHESCFWKREIYQVFERMTIAAPVQRFSNRKSGLGTGGVGRLA
jgi:hypothetical protein